MPTSNGKIYSETVGGVQYGISIEDVSNCIGENSLDVGTLCRSDKINIFAKYKPLVLGSPVELTDSQRYELNHGFTPQYITIRESGNPTKMTTWTQWRAPRDGEWSRLLDFNGYNHNATEYIKDVDVHTDHLDEQSIIINRGILSDILTVATGVTLTSQQRTQLESMLKGTLYIKVSINPDADLKLSDFHWDNALGGDLKDFYWCVALIFPKMLSSNNSPAAYGFSTKKIGDLEKDGLYDAIEFEVQTAPNTSLWTAVDPTQNINDKPLLVIGLVKSNNGAPTTFLSPCVFTEWDKYTWLKQYTSYKTWNGRKINNYTYFKGGFSTTAPNSVTLFPYNSQNRYTRRIVLTALYQIWSCDSSGALVNSGATKINATPQWRLQLRHTDGTSVTASGDIEVGTGNTRGFEGNTENVADSLGVVNFPEDKAGNYTGTLQLWVDNSNATTLATIGGEPALVEYAERLDDYNGFVSLITIQIQNYYIG